MTSSRLRHIVVALVTALTLLAALFIGAAIGAPSGAVKDVLPRPTPQRKAHLRPQARSHVQSREIPRRRSETASLGATVKPTQELATLLGPQEAMSRPDEHSQPVDYVSALRPITGERTVLPVLGEQSGADGLQWLDVMLPGRPNSHTGWIEELGTVSSSTSWHIVVDLSSRRVVVYNVGDVVRAFMAVVGDPSTPTPTGEFFVEENVQLPSTDVGAPDALALSARSTVLQEFDGGPGQIALHGVANIGGLLGTAASHGCVRLDSAAMLWLASHIGPGVPVTIDS